MNAGDALQHLEAFLERAHPGFADDARLAAQARALSEAYTAPTRAAGSEGATPASASSLAYLAHFGPRAIAAAAYALAFVDVPAACVDLGAGSGASALALFAAGARTVTLVEQDGKALDLAARLLAGVGDARFVRHAVDASADRGDSGAGLALSAFSFGEVAQGAAGAVDPRAAFAVLERAAPRARVHVIVDAGDRPHARRIQELRDALVVEGRTIVAPCPHADPCPALVRANDWCHTRIDKRLPAGLARFARNVGRDDERMAASFLVVQAPTRADADASARLPAAATMPSGVLAIGDARKEKGRARLPVCGPGGLRFVQALKRNREAHDALLEIPRGARLPGSLADGAEAGVAHVDRPDSLRLLP